MKKIFILYTWLCVSLLAMASCDTYIEKETSLNTISQTEKVFVVDTIRIVHYIYRDSTIYFKPVPEKTYYPVMDACELIECF